VGLIILINGQSRAEYLNRINIVLADEVVMGRRVPKGTIRTYELRLQN
jgi:hypothetical protein